MTQSWKVLPLAGFGQLEAEKTAACFRSETTAVPWLPAGPFAPTVRASGAESTEAMAGAGGVDLVAVLVGPVGDAAGDAATDDGERGDGRGDGEPAAGWAGARSRSTTGGAGQPGAAGAGGSGRPRP